MAAGSAPQLGAIRILRAFLQIGATTFGGMWASTRKLEGDFVDRLHWLTRDELQGLLIVSTLIPAPKFLSLGGLVGFKMGGWVGSACAVVGLIAPGASLVVAGTALVRPELLEGPLAPLDTAVGIAIIGLLFGNAYHQLRSGRLRPSQRARGVALSLVLFAAIVAGVPLILAAFAGFGLGAAMIRDYAPPAEVQERHR